MKGFIEENLVKAMAIFICHKIGLEDDPFGYFEKHDDGSHTLSVVLFDTFGKHPKSIDQPFKDYFRALLENLPVGALDREYDEIMQRSSKLKAKSGLGESLKLKAERQEQKNEESQILTT